MNQRATALLANWLLPLAPYMRTRNGRHRPGYFRDYYRRNRATLRPYRAAKAREYRAALQRATA